MTSQGRRRPRRYRILTGALGPRPNSFFPTLLESDTKSRSRLATAVALSAVLYGAAVASSLLIPSHVPTAPSQPLTQRVTLRPQPPNPPPPLPPPPVVHRAPSKAPAAAAAGKVVSAAPTPDRPLDMTGFDMVIGKGNVYAGGITASAGTSLVAVTDTRATPRGSGGSRARDAKPSRTDWSCAWPKDEEQNTDVRSVRVLIRVMVDRDGEAQNVDFLGPVAASFEAAARHCALNETYVSALDQTGRAVAGTTSPFSVHFFR